MTPTQAAQFIACSLSLLLIIPMLNPGTAQDISSPRTRFIEHCAGADETKASLCTCQADVIDSVLNDEEMNLFVIFRTKGQRGIPEDTSPEFFAQMVKKVQNAPLEEFEACRAPIAKSDDSGASNEEDAASNSTETATKKPDPLTDRLDAFAESLPEEERSMFRLKAYNLILAYQVLATGICPTSFSDLNLNNLSKNDMIKSVNAVKEYRRKVIGMDNAEEFLAHHDEVVEEVKALCPEER